MYNLMDNCFIIFPKRTNDSLNKREKYCKTINSTYMSHQIGFGNHIQNLLSQAYFLFNKKVYDFSTFYLSRNFLFI